MGVRGLIELLQNHQEIYEKFKFKKSQLVVDGSNLIQLLYYNSGLDQNHGGEYAAFEALIERFIAALTTCEVTPYVVLDGGSDPSDKKLKTVTKRAKGLIKKAHQAAVEGRKKDILPPLAKQVFKQTLARLKVPVAQCYGEADQEIAALASEWKCPVLSNDSDFYIFDLPAGLLPFCYFQWKNVKQEGSESFITCKTYHISRFCTVLKIQQQLLPTFAVLAGNDYVNLQRISWTQFAPSDSKTPSRLEGLLCWLKDFQQPQEPLEAALVLMGELSKNSKAKLLQNLSVGMKEYHLPSSSLKGFFLNGVTQKVVGPIQQVPDWIRLQLMQARLTPGVLDVLLLKRMSLSITVGDKAKPSVNLTSRPLRQVMYGLLLNGEKSVQVEERDREGLEQKFIQVELICNEVAQGLQLSSLNEAEPSKRLRVLLEALGVTKKTLKDLKPELCLPVAVTCYWLERAQPPPDLKLVETLLLGMSNEDALRARADQRTTDSSQPAQTLGTGPHHMGQEDLQAEHPNGKLNLDVAHAFNQWQVCLKDSIHLNQLLGFPLPEPDVARLYQGTLVHQLVNKMAGDSLNKFLTSKLSEDSVELYNKMLSIVQEFQGWEVSTRKRSRKRQKRGTATSS